MRHKSLMFAAGLALAIGAIGAVTAASYPAFAQEQGGTQVPAAGDLQQTPEAGGPGSDNEAAPPGVDGELFFVEQQDDQLGANDLLGHNVVNANNESVGDVNDLIVGPDGTVEALIVGVGGFLGIGEKNVGVKFDAFDVQDDPQTTQFVLTLDMSREQIEQTPAFVTKGAKIAAAQRKRELQNTNIGIDPGMTSSMPQTAPAPAPKQ